MIKSCATMAPLKTYLLKSALPESVQEELSAYDSFTQQLLWNRGIDSKGAAEHFLAPDYEGHLHDPLLMTDMERAVSRILAAVKNNEHIAIYSDYDCDGIPGGVALHDFFQAIGFTNFENYIPHRHFEGFGFNTEAVEVLKERGTALIVTIDCGISDHDAVRAANEAGIDVIITDHHLPNGTLPEAYAILNPKRDEAYPFRELCGAGVVYKLIQALVKEGRARGMFHIKEGWEKWLLDMVGLATIADMVPLIGENRALARYGLLVLRKSRRPGVQHLLRKARASQRHITEDDIGFTLAPRINAASRMDTPEDAFHMLATKDERDAGTYVSHLEKLNNERKGIVAAMSKEIKKRMNLLTELPSVIVMGNPEWKPALVGLSANSLAETYKRPVFLWGRDGKGVIKGSCRSDGETSVVALMDNAQEVFIEFGGHHGSGGFSVIPERIHELTDVLNAAHVQLANADSSKMHAVEIDADLTLDEINDSLVETLRLLAPFGEGNPKPVFRFKEVVPKAVHTFGKTKEHTKLIFETSNGDREAIAFFKTPDAFHVPAENEKKCTLIASVEESFFMNRMQRRLRIIDIV